jgi:TolB-like protein
MSLFNELKRRNVFRVATAYVVAAWLTIQVAETILPAFGFGDTALRLVIILLAIALIPTLVFSWAFEFTPKGLKREVDFTREESFTRYTGKRLDRIIMVLLVLALGYFALDKFLLEPVRDAELVAGTAQQTRSEVLAQSYGDQSIAVLPFVDLSPEGDQEYFSDGISEELLNLLARIPELRVIARTSSFSYKGKDVKIADIAAELNVDHVLEGSVRKAGNNLRISAQLIDARTETHLWSETYDRELQNIFALQDEIADKVVEQLKAELVGKVTEVQGRDPDAHDLYLRAKFIAQTRTPESLAKSISLIQEALVIDPLFAEGHGLLATLYFLQRQYGRVSTEEEQNLLLDLAGRSAIHALDLNEKLPEPYAILAVTALYRFQWQLAEENFSRAINFGPNDSQVRRWYSRQLMWLGYLEEAYAQASLAQRLDPINPSSNGNLGFVFALKGDDALAKKYAGIGRDLGLVHFYSPDLIVDLASGRWTDAAADWASGLEASGHDTELVTRVFEALENPDLIAPTLEYMESLGPKLGPAGELDIALLLLEQYEQFLSEIEGDRLLTLWSPLAFPVRQLPEFQEFVSGAGMVKYWKLRGWPDLCNPVENGFVCN